MVVAPRHVLARRIVERQQGERRLLIRRPVPDPKPKRLATEREFVAVRHLRRRRRRAVINPQAMLPGMGALGHHLPALPQAPCLPPVGEAIQGRRVVRADAVIGEALQVLFEHQPPVGLGLQVVVPHDIGWAPAQKRPARGVIR